MGAKSTLITAYQLPDWSAGSSREQEGNGGAQALPPLMMMMDEEEEERAQLLSHAALWDHSR